MPGLGAPAPTFILENVDQAMVSLEDYRDRASVLLCFSMGAG